MPAIGKMRVSRFVRSKQTFWPDRRLSLLICHFEFAFNLIPTAEFEINKRGFQGEPIEILSIPIFDLPKFLFTDCVKALERCLKRLKIKFQSNIFFIISVCCIIISTVHTPMTSDRLECNINLQPLSKSSQTLKTYENRRRHIVEIFCAGSLIPIYFELIGFQLPPRLEGTF